jgi:hypothetical protein
VRDRPLRVRRLRRAGHQVGAERRHQAIPRAAVGGSNGGRPFGREIEACRATATATATATTATAAAAGVGTADEHAQQPPARVDEVANRRLRARPGPLGQQLAPGAADKIGGEPTLDRLAHPPRIRVIREVRPRPTDHGRLRQQVVRRVLVGAEGAALQIAVRVVVQVERAANRRKPEGIGGVVREAILTVAMDVVGDARRVAGEGAGRMVDEVARIGLLLPLRVVDPRDAILGVVLVPDAAAVGIGDLPEVVAAIEGVAGDEGPTIRRVGPLRETSGRIVVEHGLDAIHRHRLHIVGPRLVGNVTNLSTESDQGY